MISIFINTLNEGKRIKDCLESVRWADEIVIVDMNSSDDTVAIARQYTQKIYPFEPMGYCEPARKFAAEQTTGEWILNVDADEIITAPLKRALLDIVKNDSADAVHLPRKNFFWGEEIRYSGCGPLQDRPLRFYKRDAVHFGLAIHAGIHLNEGKRVMRIDDPDACILHFSYDTPQHYWQKAERYTAIEAKAIFDSGRTYTFKEALKNTWNAFWKRYVKKSQGHKDGEWGLIYCAWTAVYTLNVYAQYMLMKKYGTSDYKAQIEAANKIRIDAALSAHNSDAGAS